MKIWQKARLIVSCSNFISMLHRSTIVLLRIPFSFFLMPVFFFALSGLPAINWSKALLVFVILHLIMYPASNGYNSYMDRDIESIGLLEKPPPPTRELFYLTVLLDCLAILLSSFVNILFTVCIVVNILASHAYSFRKIRLKKYPVVGFLTVVIFQGSLTYLMSYYGSAFTDPTKVPWDGMVISALLFGGFYPLTQIYQHEQDIRDGVRTISYVLGINGTFVFSASLYLAAEGALFLYFRKVNIVDFYLLQLFFSPIVIYFVAWWISVRENKSHADFRRAMRMNLIAAISMNAAFIIILVMNMLKSPAF